MSSNKMVDVRVSSGYELPDFYMQLDTEANEEALTLGAFLHEQLTYRRATADVKKLEEQKAREIAKIKADAAHKQAELEHQLADLDAKAESKYHLMLEAQAAKNTALYIGEKDTILRQHDVKIKALQSDNAILAEQRRTLEARCNQMLSDRDKDIEAAIERNTASFQRTLTEKDNTNQMLRDMLESQRTSMDVLRNDFRQFSEEHLKKTLNSRNKGAEFENVLASKLKLHYGSNPTFSLVENSKSSSGHEADMLMNWNDKSILWEAKNYSDVVKKTEVDKFQKDMKTNPYVKIGIMMSRYTTIAGKASHGDYFTERDGDQLLIYVSNSDTFGDSLYQLLPHLWTLHWEIISKSVRNEDEERDKALRMIDELVTKISKRKTEWAGIKSNFMKGINWMADAVETDEIQLKKLLKLLKSGEKEKVTDSTWEGIFLENNDDDERIEYNISIIKRICSPENDAISLNEMAEAFRDASPDPKPSLDVAKKSIRSVINPSMVEAPKGKATTINGLKLTKV